MRNDRPPRRPDTARCRRWLSAATAALLCCGTALANATLDCGAFWLRYGITSSQALSASSAQALKVRTGAGIGVVTLMLHDKVASTPLPASIELTLHRSSGLIEMLAVRRVDHSDDKTLYVADFAYQSGEALHFELGVQALGRPPQSFSIDKSLH